MGVGLSVGVGVGLNADSSLVGSEVADCIIRPVPSSQRPKTQLRICD